VGGEHLVHRAKRLAPKLACDQIGSGSIGINNADQPHAASLLQRVIHASVVAPKRAYANDRNIDGGFLPQAVSGLKNKQLFSQFERQ